MGSWGWKWNLKMIEIDKATRAEDLMTSSMRID